MINTTNKYNNRFKRNILIQIKKILNAKEMYAATLNINLSKIYILIECYINFKNVTLKS